MEAVPRRAGRVSGVGQGGRVGARRHGSGWGMSGSQRFDVFVSYGHEDADWVEVLAGNLVRSHLTVSLDRWELVPGDQLAIELQKRLAASETVVFVVSPGSVGRGWVN